MEDGRDAVSSKGSQLGTLRAASILEILTSIEVMMAVATAAVITTVVGDYADANGGGGRQRKVCRCKNSAVELHGTRTDLTHFRKSAESLIAAKVMVSQCTCVITIVSACESLVERHAQSDSSMIGSLYSIPLLLCGEVW